MKGDSREEFEVATYEGFAIPLPQIWMLAAQADHARARSDNAPNDYLKGIVVYAMPYKIDALDYSA